MKRILIILIFLTTLYSCSDKGEYDYVSVKVLFMPNAFVEEDTSEDVDPYDEDTSDDEDDIVSSDEEETTRDNDSQDILSLVKSCKIKYDFSLEYVIPESYEEAEETYLSWLSESDTDNTIIIIATNLYDDMLTQYQSNIGSQQILVCGSDIGKTLPVYSYELCTYGASFLIGNMGYIWTEDKECLFLGAYQNDKYDEALAGYTLGFQYLGGKTVTPSYLSTVSEAEGRTMTTEAYDYAANNLKTGASFVFAFAEEANYGVYDYLNENVEYYAAGSSYCEEIESGKILGTIYNCHGYCTYDYLVGMLRKRGINSYSKFGLDSGYITTAISYNYTYYIYDRIFNYYYTAVDYENEYLSTL
ncbi:MAG: hypothetical protein R3Y51_00015 [Rikenellaceae bacterium]